MGKGGTGCNGIRTAPPSSRCKTQPQFVQQVEDSQTYTAPLLWAKSSLPPSLASIVLLPPDSDVVSPTLSVLPQTPALTPAHPLQHLKSILGTVWGQQRGYERWKMSRTMLGFLKMFCLPIKLGGHHKTEYMQPTTILTTCMFIQCMYFKSTLAPPQIFPLVSLSLLKPFTTNKLLIRYTKMWE